VRLPGKRLNADTCVRVTFLAVPPHCAKHPVLAALRLQAEQCTDLEPITAQVIYSGTKPTQTDVLNHPAFGVTLLAQPGHFASEHRKTIVKTMQNTNSCLDDMALMLTQWRLRRPIQRQVTQHR
jgi:hypothetical protein